MYFTSSGRSRKFTGTSTRPEPATPKNDVSSRALLWLTIATRSPTPIPSSSSRAACRRASAPISAYVTSPPPSGGAGWSGSSTTPVRAPYTCTARSRKSDTLSGTNTGASWKRGNVMPDTLGVGAEGIEPPTASL